MSALSSTQHSLPALRSAGVSACPAPNAAMKPFAKLLILWKTNSLLWKISIFNRNINYKWQFSIAVLVYRRGNRPLENTQHHFPPPKMVMVWKENTSSAKNTMMVWMQKISKNNDDDLKGQTESAKKHPHANKIMLHGKTSSAKKRRWFEEKQHPLQQTRWWSGIPKYSKYFMLTWRPLQPWKSLLPPQLAGGLLLWSGDSFAMWMTQNWDVFIYV